MNSHRFLVRAQRIPSPAEDSERVLAGDGLRAGFPWWLLIFIGGPAFIALMLFMPGRKKPKKSESVNNP